MQGRGYLPRDHDAPEVASLQVSHLSCFVQGFWLRFPALLRAEASKNYYIITYYHLDYPVDINMGQRKVPPPDYGKKLDVLNRNQSKS